MSSHKKHKNHKIIFVHFAPFVAIFGINKEEHR